MSEIARVIPAVPVALAATVFVRRPESSFSELELKSEILRLIGQVEAAGAHVYVPRGDQDYAIRVGLRMLTLRRLVDEKDGLYRAVPEEIPLLTYYANSIAHLFEAGAPASARAAALPR
jgi:glycerol-3-phosphate O-acyltransferase